MKRITSIAWAVLMAAHAIAQGYHITGDVTGIPDGTKLYLTLVKPSYTNIDSTLINNGHFEFKGNHQEEARWALVRVEKQFSPMADFYLEDGNITIKGERYSTKVTGTPTNAQYAIYNDSISSIYAEQTRCHSLMVTTDNQARKDSCKAVMAELNNTMNRRHFDFVRRFPDSPVSLRVANYGTRDLNSTDALRLLSLLSPRLQKDEAIKKDIELAKALTLTEPGAVAPLFSLPDEKGKQVSLKDFRGKYVIIDFWASWCQPCRASFPAVADLYKQYKAKGLEVLGVSLDRSEPAWRKALAEEKAPWTMVLDNKGTVAKDYAVKTIPLLVLIDKDGKVIGRYDKLKIQEVLANIL